MISSLATSQEVTNWPARLGLTALLVLLVLGVTLLMWRGWRRRAARQADLPSLPLAPDHAGELLLQPIEGTYVSTTNAGDWLDRIVVQDLGISRPSTAAVDTLGVSFEVGPRMLWIPREGLRSVRRDRAIAGKVGERDGLVVVTWQMADRLLDTGFRTRYAADRDALVDAVNALLGQEVR